MKLYDVLLANTDIKNFCAGEKYYYLKILKQIVTLMNDKDIYQYQVEFQGDFISITVTDTNFDTDVYTITKKFDNGSRTRSIDSKKNESLIKINKYQSDKYQSCVSQTYAMIDLGNDLVENITIDEKHIDTTTDIIISTRYKDNLDLKTRRTGNILSNNSIKLLNKTEGIEYTDNIDSFLYKIAEEDKKIKVLK